MTDDASSVVVTSIFPPTRAVRQLGVQAAGRAIVVGDLKSPAEWSCPGITYVSPEAQRSSEWRTAELLPWNHYARKMLGYLLAMQEGASSIADLDDDNMPHVNWGFPPFEGEFTEVSSQPYYNVYRRFTDDFIWPRGFPLRHINAEIEIIESSAYREIGVWQALADGDPDVDAIYRLTVPRQVRFTDAEPVVLAAGTVCPFNSQNTIFTRRAFPLLYLPATVTFRSTDIVRAYVAQPVLWAAGLRIGFTGATATQERNEHDFLRDFESEIPLYLHADEVVETARAAIDRERSISDNLRAAYVALAERGLVQAEEVDLVDAWLEDVSSAGAIH